MVRAVTAGQLFQAVDRLGAVPARFAKAARAALVGLVFPPAILALASTLGTPLRGGVTWLFVIVPAIGFTVSGLMAGAAFGRGHRVTWTFGGALLLGGSLIGVAYRSLHGLTGREPIMLILLVPVAGFMLGFALAGLVGSLSLPLPGTQRRRVTGRCAWGGLLGGLIAAVPVLVALPTADRQMAQYAWMAMTVASFFACLILPYRLMGRAFRDAMDTVVAPPMAESSGTGDRT
ncbi:MAG: hypothetical protein AB1806_00095 [Acidobacteriota bacterium]